MAFPNLLIEFVSASSLIPATRNPRIHTEKQLKQIADSITAFGFNVPLLVDSNFKVIAGHGRLMASKLLGLTKVPIIRLEHLSEHQKCAFMIADNRLTENGEWDDQLLGEQLKILSEAEIDFKLEVIGFETAEIDLIIENVAPAMEGESDPADSLPEPSRVGVTQPNDETSQKRTSGTQRFLSAQRLRR
jgi:ParB-like chromosome segregation protein Spo0J